MSDFTQEEIEAAVRKTMEDLPGEVEEAIRAIYALRGFGTLVLEFKNYHLDEVGINMTKKAGRRGRQG